ncbi:MAG: protein-L-isoaspartate(D-aspartate) O-methyltransferase [Planctomyces sp.]|nr:protein-L-isoaspartate(D-aspartate) O-methyltransferase [Planctomyces sp.]
MSTAWKLNARRLRQQLERRGIRSQRVLDVMESVPRDLFVPERLQEAAWDDRALEIGVGQTISQPFIVARMTELLALEGDESVLEIGTGSGYQAVVLAKLARHVTTIERIPALQRRAQRVLADLGFDNIEFLIGDGSLGWPPGAPYDAIVATAAAPSIPPALYEQLAPGGRLVLPVGSELEQVLQCVRKEAAGPVIRSDCGCRFVPLVGEAGWAEPAEQPDEL